MTTPDIFIELRGVARTFTQGRRQVQALRGVDMQIRRGALVVLMGPSGSGKTTLLNQVGALDQPTAGEVLLDGQPLQRLNSDQLAHVRRTIGYIFQSFALLPTSTAYENVELGLRIAGNTARREWDGRIRRCLAAVGLTEWTHHRPYEMSGGQQQRIAIARALASRPQLILADEPTGDLDSKTGAQVLQLFRQLVDHENVTIVMTSHDPATIAYATDYYRLRDGEIEVYENRR